MITNSQLFILSCSKLEMRSWLKSEARRGPCSWSFTGSLFRSWSNYTLGSKSRSESESRRGTLLESSSYFDSWSWSNYKLKSKSESKWCLR